MIPRQTFHLLINWKCVCKTRLQNNRAIQLKSQLAGLCPANYCNLAILNTERIRGPIALRHRLSDGFATFTLYLIASMSSQRLAQEII
jgi:hypothetical protein